MEAAQKANMTKLIKEDKAKTINFPIAGRRETELEIELRPQAALDKILRIHGNKRLNSPSNYDLSKLTEEQLTRLANGEDLVTVLLTTQGAKHNWNSTADNRRVMSLRSANWRIDSPLVPGISVNPSPASWRIVGLGDWNKAGVRPQPFSAFWGRGGAKSTNAEAAVIDLGARRSPPLLLVREWHAG